MASTSSLFCSICGHKYEIGKHRFCAYCGRNMQLEANEGIGSNSVLSLAVEAQKGCTKPSKVATTSQASTKTISLEAFKARKEAARSTNFRSSKKAKPSEKDVTIRIGMFQFDPEKNILKPQWGKNLSLLVGPNSTYSVIHSKAIEKRKAHDRHFKKMSQDEEYELLYPDGSHALFLPGQCKTFFDLQVYKEDLGVPFSRVTLYLCSKSDITKYENSCEEKPQVVIKEEEECNNMEYESVWFDEELPEDIFFDKVEEGRKDDGGNEHSQQVKDKKIVKCPTCHIDYDVEDIEKHADRCADNAYKRTFIDLIKDLPNDEFPEEPENNINVAVSDSSTTCTKVEQVHITQILKPLVEKLEPQSRINVRRGQPFMDYMEVTEEALLLD